MISALRFKVNEDYDACIYPIGAFNDIDWKNGQPCSLGDDYSSFEFKEPQTCTAMLTITSGLNGRNILRLIETKRYIIKIHIKNGKTIELPTLQNENNKALKLDKDEDSVTFQFINYLGRSRIDFHDREKTRTLPIEIIPDKMDYEDDYIELTEALAERCAEVLLDYAGATSNVFTVSEESSKTLLEQFIFLRRFCFSENIQGLFEKIKRNPDRILIEEEEFHPLGCGLPSRKVYSHPFKYARNWTRYSSTSGNHYYLPSEIVTSHKRDNLDTPANRFLRFALEQFDAICEALIAALSPNGAQKQAECRREAERIHAMVDIILQDQFFDEIGVLDIMPQNNQVLQKREGYSQIFAAYSMIDLALQLDWRGKDDIYEGESKNVALLYEYWLFFELGRVIGSIDGCIEEKARENPFISSDNGRLTISLQEGMQSCRSFHIPHLNSKINLYYNRMFSPTRFISTKYEGSYSRPFRPDYTLAIFPDSYARGRFNGEDNAIEEGAVSYVHFDAKYRITDLTSFIGENHASAEAEQLEIEEEKAAEVTNTYKRGDLLKMHTYNDAIRRTIGSYVLYPGNGNKADYEKHLFSLYDEVLPGVGAFAIKPSISALGEDTLRRFITDLIADKAQNSSRLNRLRYYNEMVLREPSSPYTINAAALMEPSKATSLSVQLCVIGYMRADTPNDYYIYLQKAGKLKNGAKFYFYYYAIKNGTVYSHHFDIAKAGLLRIFTNQLNKTGTYQLEPVVCSIETNTLMSKTDLVQKLHSLGYMTDEKNHYADFYYVMKVNVIDDSALRIEMKIANVNAVNGNDSFSPHSPKVLPLDLLTAIAQQNK